MTHKQTFQSLVVGAVFIVLTVSSVFAQKGSLHFLVLGDWGREGKDNQIPVAHEMALDAKKKAPAFILSTGDNFYEDGVKTVTDSQWTTSWKSIYKDKSLQVPWVVSLGNHDYITDADVEVDYSKIDKNWIMPSRYYAKDYAIDDKTNVTVVIVDTTPFIDSYHEKDAKYHVNSQNTDRQLVWLDSVLSHSTSKWKIVAGHHPFYMASAKHPTTPEMVTRMLPILKKNHVQAYISGHVHNLEHVVQDGMDFYISGGGSKVEEKDLTQEDRVENVTFAAQTNGFLDVDLSSNRMTATFVDAKGKKLDVSVVKP